MRNPLFNGQPAAPTGRMLALLLIFGLALPNSAFALRPAGLEEANEEVKDDLIARLTDARIPAGNQGLFPRGSDSAIAVAPPPSAGLEEPVPLSFPEDFPYRGLPVSAVPRFKASLEEGARVSGGPTRLEEYGGLLVQRKATGARYLIKFQHPPSRWEKLPWPEKNEPVRTYLAFRLARELGVNFPDVLLPSPEEAQVFSEALKSAGHPGVLPQDLFLVRLTLDYTRQSPEVFEPDLKKAFTRSFIFAFWIRMADLHVGNMGALADTEDKLMLLDPDWAFREEIKAEATFLVLFLTHALTVRPNTIDSNALLVWLDLPEMTAMLQRIRRLDLQSIRKRVESEWVAASRGSSRVLDSHFSYLTDTRSQLMGDLGWFFDKLMQDNSVLWVADQTLGENLWFKAPGEPELPLPEILKAIRAGFAPAGLEEAGMGQEELRGTSERGVRGGGETGVGPTILKSRPIPQGTPSALLLRAGSSQSPSGNIQTLTKNSTTSPQAAASFMAQGMGFTNNPVMNAAGSRNLNTSMEDRAMNSNRFSDQNEVRMPSMIQKNIIGINNNPAAGMEESLDPKVRDLLLDFEKTADSRSALSLWNQRLPGLSSSQRLAALRALPFLSGRQKVSGLVTDVFTRNSGPARQVRNLLMGAVRDQGNFHDLAALAVLLHDLPWKDSQKAGFVLIEMLGGSGGFSPGWDDTIGRSFATIVSQAGYHSSIRSFLDQVASPNPEDPRRHAQPLPAIELYARLNEAHSTLANQLATFGFPSTVFVGSAEMLERGFSALYESIVITQRGPTADERKILERNAPNAYEFVRSGLSQWALEWARDPAVRWMEFNSRIELEQAYGDYLKLADQPDHAAHHHDSQRLRKERVDFITQRRRELGLAPAAGMEEFRFLELTPESPLLKEVARLEEAYCRIQGLDARSEMEFMELLAQGAEGYAITSAEGSLLAFFLYGYLPSPEGDVLILSGYGADPSYPAWEKALRAIIGHVKQKLKEQPIDHIVAYATVGDVPIFEAEGFGQNRTTHALASDKEGQREVREMIYVSREMLRPLEGESGFGSSVPIRYRVGPSYHMVPPESPLTAAPFLRLSDGEVVLMAGNRSYLVRAEHAGLAVLEQEQFQPEGSDLDFVVVPRAGNWIAAQRHLMEGLDAAPVDFPGEAIRVSRSPFGLILGWQGGSQGGYTLYKLVEMPASAGLEEVNPALVEFQYLALQIRRQVQSAGKDFAGSVRQVLAEYPGSFEQELLGAPKISEGDLLYVILGERDLERLPELGLSARYVTSPFAQENLRILPTLANAIQRALENSGKSATTPTAVILNMGFHDDKTALPLKEQQALISRVLEVVQPTTAGAEEKKSLGDPFGSIDLGRSLIQPVLENVSVVQETVLLTNVIKSLQRGVYSPTGFAFVTPESITEIYRRAVRAVIDRLPIEETQKQELIAAYEQPNAIFLSDANLSKGLDYVLSKLGHEKRHLAFRKLPPSEQEMLQDFVAAIIREGAPAAQQFFQRVIEEASEIGETFDPSGVHIPQAILVEFTGSQKGIGLLLGEFVPPVFWEPGGFDPQEIHRLMQRLHQEGQVTEQESASLDAITRQILPAGMEEGPPATQGQPSPELKQAVALLRRYYDQLRSAYGVQERWIKAAASKERKEAKRHEKDHKSVIKAVAAMQTDYRKSLDVVSREDVELAQQVKKLDAEYTAMRDAIRKIRNTVIGGAVSSSTELKYIRSERDKIGEIVNRLDQWLSAAGMEEEIFVSPLAHDRVQEFFDAGFRIEEHYGKTGMYSEGPMLIAVARQDNQLQAAVRIVADEKRREIHLADFNNLLPEGKDFGRTFLGLVLMSARGRWPGFPLVLSDKVRHLPSSFHVWMKHEWGFRSLQPSGRYGIPHVHPDQEAAFRAIAREAGWTRRDHLEGITSLYEPFLFHTGVQDQGQLDKLQRLLANSKAGLEETSLVVPQQGLPATWYTKADGAEIPSGWLDILDPERERILAPLANVASGTRVFVQSGALPAEVLAALREFGREAGVEVREFGLDDVPQADPTRENVYVLDVPPGTERREWVRDARAIVINLRPAGPEGRPATLRELGALINVAREADGRILQVGKIYRSDLQNDVIAIDTQL